MSVEAILGPGDFFGEVCVAGQPIRMATATAMTPMTALVIEKTEMLRALHHEPAFSNRFINYMPSRNIRIEEDLVDQLFNSSEKRLARTLLLLARYGTQDNNVSAQTKSHSAGTQLISMTASQPNCYRQDSRSRHDSADCAATQPT